MKTLLIAALVVGAMGTSTMAQENRIDRIRPDAPELAAPGPHAIGVRTIELVNKDQVDILNVEAGKPHPRYDRPMTVEVWYPAEGDAVVMPLHQRVAMVRAKHGCSQAKAMRIVMKQEAVAKKKAGGEEQELEDCTIVTPQSLNTPARMPPPQHPRHPSLCVDRPWVRPSPRPSSTTSRRGSAGRRRHTWRRRITKRWSTSSGMRQRSETNKYEDSRMCCCTHHIHFARP